MAFSGPSAIVRTWIADALKVLVEILNTEALEETERNIMARELLLIIQEDEGIEICVKL